MQAAKVIVIILITLVFLGGLGAYYAVKYLPEDFSLEDVADWEYEYSYGDEYDDSYYADDGYEIFIADDYSFSFEHPVGTYVVETDEGVTILPAPVEDGPVPDMTITIEDGDVSFATWENFEIPYFEHVVSTFAFFE